MLAIEQTITTNRFIRLKCVQERNGENIHVGEVVYGDIATLWIDEDGDAYMEMSNAFGDYLGLKKLSKFRRIIIPNRENRSCEMTQYVMNTFKI